MEVKLIEYNEDYPFVTISLTKKEARILFKLIDGNINELKYYGESLKLPTDANHTFAHPLFKQLENLGIE